MLWYAFRRLAGEPVALVVSRRPGDDPLELKRPPVPGRLVRVIVGPLPVAALDLLLRGRLDLALPPPGLLAVHERTGGSPLYALEVGRALIAGGSLDLGEALPLTATLGGLIEQRIRRLSNEARDLLLMVSALWRPLAAAFPSHGVQLSEAIESGLLVRDGDRLAFGHPIFGSVVYAHASASRRRGVHRLLADMLDDPEERALHLALAADSPDEGVATVLEEAARRAAARGAPDQAAQLAEQACRLTSYEWAGAGVRRRLASAHYHVLAGDGHRAEAILRELIARVPAGRDRAEAFATLANLSRGIPEVIELCRNAIAEAGDDLALRARLELILGWAECLAGEGYPAWERRAAAAVELAEQAADGDMLALALSGLAYSRARLGLGVEPELIERVLRLDPDGDVVVLGESPRAMLGLALAPDAPDEGRALLEEALARAAERGLFTVEWQAARYLATLECQAGNFLAAERHAARAVELARQLDVWNAIPLSLSGAAIVDAYRGRVDACRRHAEETAASARSTGDVLSVIISEHALGLLALSLGDAATAHHHLGPLLEVCSMGFVVSRMCWVLPDEIAALTVLGEVPSAEALLRELEEQADRLDHARMRAIAGRCRALVEAARGELGAALASAERAVAELENLPDRFECARGKLVQGAILRRMRRRGPARTALEEARSIFEEVGAPLWTRRCREGARPARRTGRLRRPRSPPQSSESPKWLLPATRMRKLPPPCSSARRPSKPIFPGPFASSAYARAGNSRVRYPYTDPSKPVRGRSASSRRQQNVHRRHGRHRRCGLGSASGLRSLGRHRPPRSPHRAVPAADRGRLARLGRDEPLDEVERSLRDLLPAVVDGQRVAAVGHLLDLGDAWVALLPLVGGVGDRPGNRVVLLPDEDQQRATIGVLRVGLQLGRGG